MRSMPVALMALLGSMCLVTGFIQAAEPSAKIPEDTVSSSLEQAQCFVIVEMANRGSMNSEIILLNKCTGSTWVLQAGKWVTLEVRK